MREMSPHYMDAIPIPSFFYRIHRLFGFFENFTTVIVFTFHVGEAILNQLDCFFSV
jgi:hypothetical protein